VETKQIVSSNSNVILTQQACGQCSGMSAASKRRALAFHISVRLCCMFLISKCRGKSDLCLCMTSGFKKRMPLGSADFRWILRPNTFKKWKSTLPRGILFLNPEVMHRPRSDSPLHSDIRKIQQVRTGKWIACARCLLAATMPERWPQACRVKNTFELLLTIFFVSTTTNSMKCLINWITLHTHVRFEQNPTLP